MSDVFETAPPKVDPFAVKVYVDSAQAQKDIQINLVDLDTDLTRHASIELGYRLRTADARKQYEKLKATGEILEANLDAEVRDKALAAAKKVTESSIKAAICADARYVMLQNRLIDAKHMYDMCVATENAMSSRKDMLLEVARDRRQEKNGNLLVRENGKSTGNALESAKEGALAAVSRAA